MPSYRVGGGVEGAATTLLDMVQRRQAAAAEQEKEQRGFDQRLREIMLQREDVSPDYVGALISGKPTQGINPLQTGYISKADQAAQRGDRREARYTRREFLDRPEVKEYMTIKRQADTMRRVMDEFKQGNITNNVALDQSLITLFNKLTDPTSVVRESEYARTAMNLPFFNALRGKVEKFQRGGAGLTSDDRQALIQVAEIITNGSGQLYNQALQDYTEIGKEGFPDMDINVITRGMQPYTPYQSRSGQGVAAPSFQSEQEAMASGLPPGTEIIINGRRAVIE